MSLAESITGTDVIEVGDDLGGIIISIVLWIVVTVLFAVILWLFGVILWTGIVVFIAMLYWIFFRALRLVFKNSKKCKGDLPISVLYGISYTLFYNFWIYGLILCSQYLIM